MRKRKQNGRSPRINVALTQEMLEAVVVFAKGRETSESAICRELIANGLRDWGVDLRTGEEILESLERARR